MSQHPPKNPKDFEIPESYRAIGPGELWKASEDPALRPMVRFFADQVQDVLSYYLKVGETEAEKAFLIQCRKDSRAFRKALEKELRKVAEANKNDSRIDFILENLACSNRSEGGYLFSVELRPLYFSSLLEDDEKEGKRYPTQEGRYTVFLHFDQKHRYQTSRFMVPEVHSQYTQYIMSKVLEVFSSQKIQELFEKHYGDWETISEQIVAEMVGSLRSLR